LATQVYALCGTASDDILSFLPISQLVVQTTTWETP